MCFSNKFRSIKDTVEFEGFSQGHDPVTKQYESLPYPPFGENKLEYEEQFYKRSDSMAVFSLSNALETINQYLHRGKESFG